jgi:hypothetical protein
MKALALLLVSVACALGQQSANGAYFTPAPPLTVPQYGGVQAASSGTSPMQFAISGSAPVAGTMILGIISQAGTTGNVTKVCDGTGSDGCTGSDTFTILSAYVNGTNFSSTIFYVCSAASATSANLTISWTGSSGSSYAGAIEIWGAASSGCVGGHVQNKGASGTTYSISPSTLTPTSTNSLMVGLSSNFNGNPITAGNDGQGNSYTLRANSTNVVGIETLAETSVQAYLATMTGPSTPWNMDAIVINGAPTTGAAIGWGGNGANFQNTVQANGAFFGGSVVGDFLWDMHGATNGVAPTIANVFASSYGLSGSGGITVSRIDTMVYSNAMQPVTLVTPVVIGGVGYGGGGGLGIHSPTRNGGSTVDEVTSVPPSPGATSESFGFSFYSNCTAPTTGFDCSSLSGYTVGANYTTQHIGQLNNVPGLSGYMENFIGVTLTPYSIQPNTLYRGNIQVNSSVGNYLLLCDAGNRLIASWSGTAGYNSGTVNNRMGQVGEVPPTAGYDYYFWNFVDTGTGAFNSNGPCF